MIKKKIMVVDDEPDLVMVTKSRLEANHYEVVTAVDGIEALEKAKTERPDLIILDILMPRMDGIEFIREFRQLKDGSHKTPIIILSARTDMKEALDPAEIVGFIAKPYESQHLLSKVQEAVGRSSA